METMMCVGKLRGEIIEALHSLDELPWDSKFDFNTEVVRIAKEVLRLQFSSPVVEPVTEEKIC